MTITNYMLRNTIIINPADLNADTTFLLKRLLASRSGQLFFDDKTPPKEEAQTYDVPSVLEGGLDDSAGLSLSLVKYRRKKNPAESRYAVCELLARGGESMVYTSKITLLFQPGLDGNLELVSKLKTKPEKIRIIKQLHLHFDDDGKIISDSRSENQKAKNEFHFLNQVGLPGLKAPILSEDDSRSALIMHRIEGRPLYDLIETNEHPAFNFTTDQLLDLSILICDAVMKVHQGGIIHRDLKPENIIVKIDQENNPDIAVVIDFGLAKWRNTKVKETVGTFSYASLEAKRNRPTDEKSDVYSLGLIFYYLWRMQNDQPAYTQLNTAAQQNLVNVVNLANSDYQTIRPSVAAMKSVFTEIKMQRMSPQSSSVQDAINESISQEISSHDISGREKKSMCIIC